MHTHSSEHTPGAVGSHLCCGARGAVGVRCLAQGLPARDSNPWPLDYESDSLTIRPRLPHDFYDTFMVLLHLFKLKNSPIPLEAVSDSKLNHLKYKWHYTAQRFSGIISVKWWQKELGRVYHREQNTLNKSQFIFNKRKAWLGQRAGVICDAVVCVAVLVLPVAYCLCQDGSDFYDF